jgi:hypothetical protein
VEQLPVGRELNDVLAQHGVESVHVDGGDDVQSGRPGALERLGLGCACDLDLGLPAGALAGAAVRLGEPWRRLGLRAGRATVRCPVRGTPASGW